MLLSGGLHRQALIAKPLGRPLLPRFPGSSRARSNVSRGINKRTLLVKAIAAPEKPKAGETPFTAWATAIQRVAIRDDLKTIMILGAGPIVIGQVCVATFINTASIMHICPQPCRHLITPTHSSSFHFFTDHSPPFPPPPLPRLVSLITLAPRHAKPSKQKATKSSSSIPTLPPS